MAKRITRRSLLKTGATALAAPMIVPSSVFGQNAPSNRIAIGAIGVGRISRIHDMHETFQYDTAQIVAVCDLDSRRVASGGACDLTRRGEHVATLKSTPGTVKVDKTKNDILLTCKLAGYQEASVNLESGYGVGTFGNIILGGGIGWAIDSATGADNKYPSSAAVQFVPLGAIPPAPAPNPNTVLPR